MSLDTLQQVISWYAAGSSRLHRELVNVGLLLALELSACSGGASLSYQPGRGSAENLMTGRVSTAILRLSCIYILIISGKGKK